MTLEDTQDRCFHCGEALPPGKPLSLDIDGVPRPMCCHGCLAVAGLITGANMSAFYSQRTDFAPQPDTVDQRIVNWFHDRDWVSTFTQQTPEGVRLPLLVSGMSCAACTWIIEKFLLARPEVISVDINLSHSRVVITLQPEADPAGAIEELLQLGYSVRPWRTDERLEQLRRDNRRDLRRLGVAGLGMMQVGMFAIALHAGDLQGISSDIQQLLRAFSAPLTLFVLVYSGRSFFTTAWQHLRRGALVMDSSVSLALIIATIASLWSTWQRAGNTYYDSITMFIFFLLLARYIEKRLRDADLIALIGLEDSLPEFVTAKRKGHWVRTPRDRIEVGDTLRVAAGEAIAFDGTVLGGNSAVDEAVFTGESLPRSIAPRDTVYAGTVNREASIDIHVDSSYRNSRFASLAEDVDRARHAKPPYLQLIDRLAARFVGLVIVAATMTFAAWFAIDREHALWSALAVLVVACPCALSLATPAAMAAVTAWLRRKGVLVSGEFGLLALAEVDHVLIDKTGTLTETTLAVHAIKCAPDTNPDHNLSLASALQQLSSHPAARAFHDLPVSPEVDAVEVIAGAGMEGRLRSTGDVIRLGSADFCRQQAPDLPPEPDTEHYWIALVVNARWLAWIGLSETLRTGAYESIQRLKSLGLQIQLLSGDQQARVATVADQLDVGFQASMSPADKLGVLQTLQRKQHKVLAIGDGLNDAPLLGAADASVAVPGATALAQAQADFVITDDNLVSLATLVLAARRGRRIMRQNLCWAAGYNIVGIPFAALGYVPPWAAALGMSLSSLLVVVNALRLRRMVL